MISVMATSISVAGSGLQLTSGQHAALQVEIKNSGELQGAYSLSGVLIQQNGDVGGHLVAPASSSSSSGAATGTIAGGAVASVELVSEGAIADQSQVGPSLGFQLTLTDTTTGETTTYTASGVWIPPETPSQLGVVGITASAA